MPQWNHKNATKSKECVTIKTQALPGQITQGLSGWLLTLGSRAAYSRPAWFGTRCPAGSPAMSHWRCPRAAEKASAAPSSSDSTCGGPAEAEDWCGRSQCGFRPRNHQQTEKIAPEISIRAAVVKFIPDWRDCWMSSRCWDLCENLLPNRAPRSRESPSRQSA